jgi:fluoroacetyl-CoA thioesterase
LLLQPWGNLLPSSEIAFLNGFGCFVFRYFTHELTGGSVMSSPFQPGMTHELAVKTGPEDSAQKFYPHLPDVFATPRLVGLMERVSAELMNQHLQTGEQSVGISMNLKHTAATPLGMEVRVKTEVTAVEGRKLTFRLEAFDEAEKIGEAVHERFVIQAGKFTSRVEEKAKTMTS